MDDVISFITNVFATYTFYYPLLMSFVWIAGASIFWVRNEAGHRSYQDVSAMENLSPITVLIPCYNESAIIVETIEHLDHQTYPGLEVLAINDGSSDDTGAILDRLAQKYSWLRVVHLAENHGKAMAMRAGALLARSEILIGIDGDALLDEYAPYWFAKSFDEDPRLGAVTGNPRIRNRSTLLGLIQVGEFSSIVGLIKRAERVYGRIFTVSGVCAAFRRTALHDVGYWRTDMLTEDVDISWRLQLRHWQIRYEPRALCWILMPETFGGLWKQRLRWARGGAEVLMRYFGSVFRWESRRLWPIYVEYIAGITWAYAMLGAIVFGALGLYFGTADQTIEFNPLPGWAGLILAFTFLVQTTLALFIDRRYERRIVSSLFWVIWYPVAYWVIMGIAAIAGSWLALTKSRLSRATWSSPDRGVAKN